MLASPLEQDTKVDITDLTHASVEGNGVFDVLMRAVNAHLQKEWSANRLKGTEYSTVYLGALESTMNASLQFLLAKDKTNAEIDILKQQLVNLKVDETNAIKQGLLLDKQLDDLVAATALKTQQKANLADELLTNAQQRSNLVTEQARIAAQTTQINAETLNVPKQGLLIDAQKETQLQQKLNLANDLLTATQQRTNLVSENQAIIAKTANTAQQTANLLVEAANIPKQGELIDAQKNVQTQQKLNLEAQKLNIPKEGALVDAQKALTDQKLLTEQDALLTATAQRSVLSAQTAGFVNDAKQKAAEIMIKGFSVVSTTNDLTQIQSADYGVSTTKVKAALDALVP